MSKILCYMDGGCSKNPGFLGSWAYSIYSHNLKKTKKTDLGINLIEHKVGFVANRRITSNVMELTAFLMALRSINASNYNDVEFFSDSQYLVGGFNGKIKLKANFELWEIINKETVKIKKIACHWVKGHSSSSENNFVDKMLKSCSSKLFAIQNKTI